MAYQFRGMTFNSMITLEKYFCLRSGAGDRLLENGEIKIVKI